MDSLEINAIGVIVGAPDFVLENIFIDKTDFQLSPVEVVNFEILLRNQGADFVAGANPVIIEIRLSDDDQTFDAGDTLIGTVPFDSDLSSGVSAVVEGSFQIDPSTPVGNFFIAFAVDPDLLVVETDESNNTARRVTTNSKKVSSPSSMGPAWPAASPIRNLPRQNQIAKTFDDVRQRQSGWAGPAQPGRTFPVH